VSDFTREIVTALSAPFGAEELEFRAGAVSGTRALALPYIQARDVMNRLDTVVGAAGWSYDFDLLSGDGRMVRGRLTVLGVTKCDAGESGGEDEPLKSAVSDALKRAAVHFGIGRYLYSLPKVWGEYDAQKKRFVNPQAVAAELGAAVRNPSPQTPPYGQAAGAQSVAVISRPLPARAPAVGGGTTAAARVCTGCRSGITEKQSEATVARFGGALCTACARGTTPKGRAA
jgi:hypothetical protein